MSDAPSEFEILGPLPIPSRIRRGILRCAQEGGDAESCGLILGRDSQVLAWYPCRNAHDEPDCAFLLHPQDLRDALEMGERLDLQVIGLWHSHPHGPAVLSAEDQDGRPRDWLQWLVAPKGSRKNNFVVARRGLGQI